LACSFFGVSHAAISKLEKPNRNIHVDQLRSIVSTRGGTLTIVADFEDRKVELSHIGKAGDSYVKERAVAPACSRALNRPERGRKYSTWSLPTCDAAALHRYKNPRNAMYNGF
jgi:hypothetical protein